MSAEAIGVVEKVNTSFSQDPNKKWTKKSFKINADWYSAFLNKDNKAMLEAVNEGDSVRVGYITKGDFKNLDSIETVARAEKNPVPTAGKAAPVPYNPNVKEKRITFLASRRDAIEFVKALIQTESVSLGAKKGDKADIFYGLVNKYAARMAADAWDADNIKADETINAAVEDAKTYATE